MNSSRIAATLALVATAVTAAGAQNKATDWPQWRGPNRDGVSTETGLLKQWPAEGPKLAWKGENLGGGYGSVAVAGGRIYGLAYRGGDEVLWALDESNGKELWATPYAKANHRPKSGRQGPEGTRSTPTIDGDQIFVEGDSGDVAAFDRATGKVQWKKDLVADFGGTVPTWGFSESPLVDGNKVIVTPGGRDATIVALDRKSGDVIWKSAVPEGDRAHYSSAIKATFNDQPQYIQFVSGGVVGVSAADGKYLWRYNTPANRTANISSPIFKDGVVFAASGYNTGGGAAKLAAENGAITATEMYFSRRMQNHHGGVVLVGDHVYGFDNSTLTCMDFKTGDVKWADRSVGKGALTYADGMLYCRSERGPVALVEATPTAYVEKGRFDQPERRPAASWAHPVIANGKLYLRDQDILLCYDVKAP